MRKPLPVRLDFLHEKLAADPNVRASDFRIIGAGFVVPESAKLLVEDETTEIYVRRASGRTHLYEVTKFRDVPGYPRGSNREVGYYLSFYVTDHYDALQALAEEVPPGRESDPSLSFHRVDPVSAALLRAVKEDSNGPRS